MSHICLEFSLVPRTIRVLVNPLTRFLPLEPIPGVFVSAHVRHGSLSRCEVIKPENYHYNRALPFSLVNIAIRICQNAESVLFIIFKLAFIDVSKRECENTLALSVSFDELSLVAFIRPKKIVGAVSVALA